MLFGTGIKIFFLCLCVIRHKLLFLTKKVLLNIYITKLKQILF